MFDGDIIFFDNGYQDVAQSESSVMFEPSFSYLNVPDQDF